MHPSRAIALLILAVLLGITAFLITRREASPTVPAAKPGPSRSADDAPGAADPLPGERLMAAYADPATEPIEDLRSLDRVLTGYFSIIKDHEGYAIGGNEDLAACLRGENAYRQPFLPADHPAFGPQGRLLDRWGSPVFVHPLAAGKIELRSAGPDREMFTDDDTVLEKPGPRGL